MLKAVTFLGAAAFITMLAAPVLAEGLSADTVVVSVNGTDVTLGQMIAVREGLPAQYKDLPDDVLFKGVLDQIIQQIALSQVAEQEVTPKMKIDIENQRRSYLAASILNKAAAAAVTDEALKKLFDERFTKAAPVTEYNAAHILVATEDEAKAIKAQLGGGADFAEIARAKSTDTGSAQSGGSLGWFGPGMMVEPFEKAVASMKPGQVSDPVQTQFGWHVIKLTETRPAAGPTFEEKREELAGELQQTAIKAMVDDLTGKADVKKMTDGIDPAILKDATLLGE
jgi:peptidyl-prolyl cis-trans isomerase C